MSIEEKNKKVAEDLKQVSGTVQGQLQSQTQMQNALLEIQRSIGDFKKELSQLATENVGKIDDFAKEIKLLANALQPEVRDLDSIPGVRTPKWYQAIIPFQYRDSAEKFTSIDINPEGPFVITQITPLWVVGDGLTPEGSNLSEYFVNGNLGLHFPVASGRVLPCTAFPFISKTLGYTNSDGNGRNTPSAPQLFYRSASTDPDEWGVLSDIPEMFFQIQVSGTGKFWTNQPISAAAFYGYFGRPLDVGVLGWVDRGDRITISATPSVPVPHIGRVFFILHGYQILGDVSISKELGY